MAAQMLRPSVVSFLEVVTSIDDVQLDLQDVVINQGSEMIGRTLRDLKIPDRFGLVVIAAKKLGASRMSLNPKSDLSLNVGDLILVLGNDAQVKDLKQLAGDSGYREHED
jgi:voltage-gated potassium channel